MELDPQLIGLLGHFFYASVNLIQIENLANGTVFEKDELEADIFNAHWPSKDIVSLHDQRIALADLLNSDTLVNGDYHRIRSCRTWAVQSISGKV